MKSTKLKNIILLVIIVLLALFLRLYHFTSDPPSLYSDEVAIGYNAYSILQTGKDEWGVKYPLLFRSFDDYKTPLYIYTVTVFEKVFGLNEISVRLPSVIAGTLSVFFLFFLVKELFRDRHSNFLAFLSSLFLAISPWHIQFSRAGFETNLALFFVILGTWLFLLAIRKNLYLLFLSGISFVLSIYAYHSERLFTPIYVAILAIIFYRPLISSWKNVFLVALVPLIILLPFMPTYFSPEGRIRFLSESVVNQPGELKTNLVNNYVANFSMDYLFFRGDQGGRHSVKKIGELYLWQIPFVLVGMYFLVRKRSKASLVIFSWLMLGALPPAITKVSPHSLRGILMVPPWQIISALGLLPILKYIQKLKYVLAGVVIFALALYLHIYYVHYPVSYAADWSDGDKQAVEFLHRVEPNYEQIFLTPNLNPESFLFYSAYDPKILQASGHNTTALGKYHYADLNFAPPKDSPGEKDLVVAPAGDVPKKFEIVREIQMVSGDPVYDIYEY